MARHDGARFFSTEPASSARVPVPSQKDEFQPLASWMDPYSEEEKMVAEKEKKEAGAPMAIVAAPRPDMFSAEDTMKALTKKGVNYAKRTTGQILCSSFLGGAMLGYGGALMVVVAGGSATAMAGAPGLTSLLAGAVFPVGLSMIVLSGSELLTGNFMTMALPAWTLLGVNRGQVVANIARVWGLSGVGNLAGSVFLASVFYYTAAISAGTPAAAWLAALALKKCSLSPLVAIVKGACANWLVAVAIFQAASVHTASGKIASLWFPIMTFVALGFEHSIANMFLLPLGMLTGADVSVMQIIGNIVPVALGNALGAIIFVAGLQRYSLLKSMLYSKRM